MSVFCAGVLQCNSDLLQTSECVCSVTNVERKMQEETDIWQPWWQNHTSRDTLFHYTALQGGGYNQAQKSSSSNLLFCWKSSLQQQRHVDHNKCCLEEAFCPDSKPSTAVCIQGWDAWGPIDCAHQVRVTWYIMTFKHKVYPGSLLQLKHALCLHNFPFTFSGVLGSASKHMASSWLKATKEALFSYLGHMALHQGCQT